MVVIMVYWYIVADLLVKGFQVGQMFAFHT